MIASLVCSLHSFFATRRLLLLSLAGVYVAACLFLVTRLELVEDISAFIPDTSPELSRSFDLLRHAPFVQSLSITVADGHDPAPTARQLAKALEKTGSYTVLSAVESSPRATIDFFYKLLPGTLSEHRYEDLKTRLSFNAIRHSLEKAVKDLSGLGGLARAPFVAKDAIGIAELAGPPPVARGMQSGIAFSNGLIQDSNGENVLLLARPADAFTNASHAPTLMHEFREAVAALPETALVSATGGLAHTDANTATIRKDLQRVLPLAFVMLLLTFLFMFHNRQGLFVFLVPVIAIASASAGASLFVASLSGIALGFGSVLLGVTDDYPIHIYCAAQSASSVPEALRDVLTPLLAGSCSALMAFGVFLFSGIPGVRQIAVFAMTGICSAVFFSLVVLPHVLRPRKSLLSQDVSHTEHPAHGSLIHIRWGKAALIWIAVGLALWAGISHSTFDGDIRNLSYISGQVADAEARHNTIWGDMNRGGLVVASGKTLEDALIVNDAVWDSLQEYPPEELPATSIAPVLPSQARQLVGHARWEKFWHEHRSDTLLAVKAEAGTLGFAPTAFDPFFAFIESAPQPVTASDIVKTDFGLLYTLLVREQADSSAIYTLLGTDTLPPGLHDRLTRAGGIFVSGETFRAALSDITQKEITANCLLALALICGISLVTFRNGAKAALILLPLAISLAVILAVFAVWGIRLTLFHAVAFPLIMMLGLDYGIFVVAYAYQGAGSVAYRGIFISAFTTIAGFGCLIFARHPALHSLGVTATLGMVMAAVVSVYFLPRLMVVEGD